MNRFIQKWGLGWLGVYMYATSTRKHRFIDACMRKLLGDIHQTEINERFSHAYNTALAETTYWHGTGMYQYDKDFAVIDSFDRILKSGGLRPNKDVFDIQAGEMTSVSCTRIRMYARIYADMHECGGPPNNTRHGEPYVWGYYFIVSSALMAVHNMKLWSNIIRRRHIASNVKQDMKKLWVTKVRHTPFRSLKDFFVHGSDIENNFGILIGIKDIDSVHISSAYISMYETRSTKIIPTKNWSHVEVPKAHIAQIESMLASNSLDIPVFAIEETEKYWSKKPFSALVNN